MAGGIAGALPPAVVHQLRANDDVDGHQHGMHQIGKIPHIRPAIYHSGTLGRFNDVLHVPACHTDKVVQLCWNLGLLLSQLFSLLHCGLLEHQLCPQQIGLLKLVLLIAVPEVLLVLLPRSAQSHHQVLQPVPVPFVSIPVLKILHT